MKVFVAHLIVMGILKKNSLEQYWSRDSILNMPFFGHYMSRYHFQNILWNLHVSDPDETNPPKGEADHDPLFLVRPMVDMMQRNFHTKYRPGKELSLDESTCPFKGRVHFKCYNPKKPNRFHIKLFMVSEPSTGYTCGLEVYTGDASGQSQGNAQEVQDASKTSCTVLGLLDSIQNMVILNAHILNKKYSDSKKMHWQLRIELVKHMVGNTQQQPWGIVPVPDPVDCPLCLVDKHFIEPIPGQEGARRKHPGCLCFVCNVSKEAFSDAGFGDSYKSKKYTSYWCSICKCALCIDPCFRLYHTEKDYTSEIIKIARMSVKPIQKDAQHV